MGEQLAAKVYWDRETGFICFVTDPSIEGLDKVNLALDLGKELMKFKCHSNNEQPLTELYPVLHYDAEESRLLGEQSKHLDTLSGGAGEKEEEEAA